MLTSRIRLKLLQRRLAMMATSAGEAHLQVGVLLDSENRGVVEMFQSLRKEMDLPEDKFKILICRDMEKEINCSEYPVLSVKDISLRSISFSEGVEEFLAQKFQYLISFCSPENKLARVIVSNISACFKIGMGNGVQENQLYDLSIMAGLDNPTVFVKEVGKYLKIINKETHE